MKYDLSNKFAQAINREPKINRSHPGIVLGNFLRSSCVNFLEIYPPVPRNGVMDSPAWVLDFCGSFLIGETLFDILINKKAPRIAN